MLLAPAARSAALPAVPDLPVVARLAGSEDPPGDLTPVAVDTPEPPGGVRAASAATAILPRATAVQRATFRGRVAQRAAALNQLRPARIAPAARTTPPAPIALARPAAGPSASGTVLPGMPPKLTPERSLAGRPAHVAPRASGVPTVPVPSAPAPSAPVVRSTGMALQREVVALARPVRALPVTGAPPGPTRSLLRAPTPATPPLAARVLPPAPLRSASARLPEPVAGPPQGPKQAPYPAGGTLTGVTAPPTVQTDRDTLTGVTAPPTVQTDRDTSTSPPSGLARGGSQRPRDPHAGAPAPIPPRQPRPVGLGAPLSTIPAVSEPSPASPVAQRQPDLPAAAPPTPTPGLATPATLLAASPAGEAREVPVMGLRPLASQRGSAPGSPGPGPGNETPRPILPPALPAPGAPAPLAPAPGPRARGDVQRQVVPGTVQTPRLGTDQGPGRAGPASPVAQRQPDLPAAAPPTPTPGLATPATLLAASPAGEAREVPVMGLRPLASQRGSAPGSPGPGPGNETPRPILPPALPAPEAPATPAPAPGPRAQGDVQRQVVPGAHADVQRQVVPGAVQAPRLGTGQGPGPPGGTDASGWLGAGPVLPSAPPLGGSGQATPPREPEGIPASSDLREAPPLALTERRSLTGRAPAEAVDADLVLQRSPQAVGPTQLTPPPGQAPPSRGVLDATPPAARVLDATPPAARVLAQAPGGRLGSPLAPPPTPAAPQPLTIQRQPAPLAPASPSRSWIQRLALPRRHPDSSGAPARLVEPPTNATSSPGLQGPGPQVGAPHEPPTLPVPPGSPERAGSAPSPLAGGLDTRGVLRVSCPPAPTSAATTLTLQRSLHPLSWRPVTQPTGLAGDGWAALAASGQRPAGSPVPQPSSQHSLRAPVGEPGGLPPTLVAPLAPLRAAPGSRGMGARGGGQDSSKALPLQRAQAAPPGPQRANPTPADRPASAPVIERPAPAPAVQVQRTLTGPANPGAAPGFLASVAGESELSGPRDRELDDMARRLYPRLRWMMAAELRLDRERSGRVLDVRR